MSLKIVLKEDRFILLFGCFFSLIFSYVLIYGFFFQNLLSIPLTYAGDGIHFLFEIQRLLEGWLFNNGRSGYPFGSTFYDFASSETTSLFLLKGFAHLFKSAAASMNAYIFFSFIANFSSAFIVMRLMKLSKVVSFMGAMLFNFLPFHFSRFPHLFYVLYFCMPIYFYYAYKVYEEEFENGWTFFLWIKKNLWSIPVLMICASTGVYYAAFAVIIIVASSLGSFFKNESLKPLLKGSFYSAIIAGTVCLNVLPSILYNLENGKNVEVAQRGAAESEIYGLKLAQLVMPRADHRIEKIGKLTQKYNAHMPLVNENATSTLGVVGSLGFFAILLYLFSLGSRFAVYDSRLSFLAITTFCMFLFATVGGISVLFASLISPLIRGWNRISPFVAFSSLAFLSVIFDVNIKPKISKKMFGYFILFMIGIGLYDQTVPANPECLKQTKTSFEIDKKIIERIEDSLPKGSDVFQYPYVPFPEWHHINQLGTYDLALGFIHSKTLKWNYAGMKGREGDLFYRALDQEPLSVQLEVIKKLGFQGIYIDHRGYKDNGEKIISEFTQLLGYEPEFTSDDGKITFFRIKDATVQNFDGLTPKEIMKKVGFYADKHGKRQLSTSSEGFDFTKQGIPIFIKDVKGLSGCEPWGRWSVGHVTSFIFQEFLPNNFKLTLKANAFGDNVGQKMEVKIGEQSYFMDIECSPFEKSIDVHLNNQKIDKVEFIIPKPQKPGNGDQREIGIGFVHLKIEEKKQ